MAKLVISESSRHLTYRYLNLCLECSRFIQRAAGKRTILLLDASGAGYQHVDMDLGRHLYNLMYAYYPENIEKVYVFSLPWLLTGSWAMISSILPEGATRKVQFISNWEEVKDLDLESIPAVFGGFVSYNHDPRRSLGHWKLNISKFVDLIVDEMETISEVRFNPIQVESTHPPAYKLVLKSFAVNSGGGYEDVQQQDEEEFWDCVEYIEDGGHQVSENVKTRPFSVLRFVQRFWQSRWVKAFGSISAFLLVAYFVRSRIRR